MRLRGKLAGLMVKVAPEIYTKYVIINAKGETVLHVRLLNALYGIMKAALLYYQIWSSRHHYESRQPKRNSHSFLVSFSSCSIRS
jgi:hypothetical protein